MHTPASGSPLPGFLNSLAGPLNHYGLLAVLFFVLIEDFGIPVPGETILIAASIYAGSGRLNVVGVGIIGFVAAVAGDNIGFAIGHYGGRALVLRWGRYVRLTEERLDKAEAFFARHGGWIITVARFIEVLRQVNGLVAGISGMRWRRFLVFNALGAALWVGTWVSLGYFAGNHIGTIYHYVTQYSAYALIALAVLLAASIAWRLLLRRRSRATPTREQAAQPSQRRPSASEAAITEPTASQPTEATEPLRDS
jgi:membrane protein DedA with SNARE-associated domain